VGNSAVPSNYSVNRTLTRCMGSRQLPQAFGFSMTAKRTIRIFCGNCEGYKNHKVVAKREVRSHDDEPYHWGEDHYFCQCAGCDTYCYAVAEYTEDDFNNYTGEMDYRWKTYPYSKNSRKPLADVDNFPQKVKLIDQETIGALNAQLPVLTAIGLRAIIEAICVEQEVAGRTLEKKIGSLANSGILSTAQAKILHGHRFLGNIAVHEIVSANPRELIAALEIAETMLKTIYVLPSLSAQIKTGRKP
jgi:hypothetical protein